MTYESLSDSLRDLGKLPKKRDSREVSRPGPKAIAKAQALGTELLTRAFSAGPNAKGDIVFEWPSGTTITIRGGGEEDRICIQVDDSP